MSRDKLFKLAILSFGVALGVGLVLFLAVPSFRKFVSEFQPLISAFIALAAAAIAFLNVSRQIEAGRQIEREKLQQERASIAAGLAGELQAAARQARVMKMAEVYEAMTPEIRKQMPRVQGGIETYPVYKEVVGKIGMLPAPLPELATFYYGRLIALRMLVISLNDPGTPDAAVRVTAATIAMEVRKLLADAPVLVGWLERVRDGAELPPSVTTQIDALIAANSGY
jgi:hypothetical protein